MQPAIRIENLTKRYDIGSSKGAYRTLRESVASSAAACWQTLRRGWHHGARPEGAGLVEPFYAVKDVSLDVQSGDVIGIVGRNGAGKSTLLKLLSRITEPTHGRIELRGRVGSLLEVGTGFHPELSGRENIFLNGAILGMSRHEIARQFDSIVDFAEVGRFLDMPVKRYSSGMYVRLAFAVAAHLEPEILIVDEVLAVGDMAFQKKCLSRLGDVSQSGRTVLFVSHNMAAVRNLCKKVAIMQRGEMTFFGDCDEGVRRYQSTPFGPQGSIIDLKNHPNRRPGTPPLLEGVRLLDANGNATDQFNCGEPMTIELMVQPPAGKSELRFGIWCESSIGGRLFTVASTLSQSVLPPMAGPSRLLCSLGPLPLAPDRYTLSFQGGPLYEADADLIEQAVSFDVNETDYYGNGKIPKSAWGSVLMRSEWSAEAN